MCPYMCTCKVNASAEDRALLGVRAPEATPVKMLTAGSSPPAAVIQAMEALGFDVTHVYGLTEVYGPAVSCPWNEEEWGGERERLDCTSEHQQLRELVAMSLHAHHHHHAAETTRAAQTTSCQQTSY